MKNNLINRNVEKYKMDVLPSLMDNAREHLVSEFEDSLPEYIGKLETELREKYLEETLPGYLEELEGKPREQFMGKTLLEELEQTETTLIEEYADWLTEKGKEAKSC